MPVALARSTIGAEISASIVIAAVSRTAIRPRGHLAFSQLLLESRGAVVLRSRASSSARLLDLAPGILPRKSSERRLRPGLLAADWSAAVGVIARAI